MKKMLFRKSLIISIVFLLISSGFLSVSGGFLSEKENQDITISLSHGDYFRFIRISGRIRSYRLHIPPSYNGENPMSIVFALHGSGVPAVNSFTFKDNCDLDEKADDEGFIVVYPNGERFRFSPYLKHPAALLLNLYAIITSSRMWNCWDINNVNDVEFIENLIGHLQTKLNVNSSRIFITGVSGGAMMTYRLGAELSDSIAAIAPIAGAIGGKWLMPEPDDSLSPYIIPEPTYPLPVIVFHGMQDTAVPYEGGWVKVLAISSDELWTYSISVNESVSFWVEYNNCELIPQINVSESGRIITRTYTNGSDSSEVVLITYVDGGHEWFKSPPHEMSATDLMWEFFEQHPKQ